jgi:hypothetical protein
MPSWQVRQTTRVLRRREAIRTTHSDEVFERPDVVHLNLMLGAAEFAGVGQESLHEF